MTVHRFQECDVAACLEDNGSEQRAAEKCARLARPAVLQEVGQMVPKQGRPHRRRRTALHASDRPGHAGT